MFAIHAKPLDAPGQVILVSWPFLDAFQVAAAHWFGPKELRDEVEPQVAVLAGTPTGRASGVE
jgi:hypothetical protein